MAEYNTSEQNGNNPLYQHRFYRLPINGHDEIKNCGQFGRRQQQKSGAKNITIITTVRPPKGKQRNYSDSNILRARKARVSLSRGSKLRRNLLFLSFQSQKVPIEVELSRKHQVRNLFEFQAKLI